MSQETREWLNRYILVGNVEHRPKAWHDDPRLRARLSLPSNHFEGPIPYQTVVDRLFDWLPMVVPTANLIPCAASESKLRLPMALDLGGHKFKQGQPVKLVVVQDMQGIVRSDTFEEVGHHTAGYMVHVYEKWLLQILSNVLGDTLTILGAGLLRNGAQAFVQVALPQSIFDDTTGVDFWPYIMCATSLDGSMATTFSGQTLLVVCDNTRDSALHQGEMSGRIYKARHTSKSLDASKIRETRQALRIIEQTGDTMMQELHELAAINVSRRQWNSIMDIIEIIGANPKRPFYVPTSKEAKPLAISRAEDRRSQLDHTYTRDPMAKDWRGTALGVVQAVNTWETHYKQVRGNRVTRNLDKAIRGHFGATDRNTVQAIASVLERPDLLSRN